MRTSALIPWKSCVDMLPGEIRAGLQALYVPRQKEVANMWCLVEFGETEIAGVMRFFWRGDEWIHETGTVIRKKYRGRGIALKLWAEAIYGLHITEVNACAVNKKGAALLGAIVREFYDIVEFNLR